MRAVILASSSPRRKELFTLTGWTAGIVPPAVEETIDEKVSPEETVLSLAEQKVDAVCPSYPDRLVIGCDTLVTKDGRQMGKPEDAVSAQSMLEILSGGSHRVLTGCVFSKSSQRVRFYSEARVTFSTLSEAEIKSYIQSGECFGKAGAYAIQGSAARFVEHIEGDYYAIMGLPVSKVYRFLKAYQDGNLF